MSVLPFPQEINTLLVDDEDIAIHRLKRALAVYPEFKIVGEVKDGKSAVEFINHYRPDLVFLDIQMPGFNGFEVLNHLEYMPLIVFVTSYEHYAVQAFEKNSLDYLLKPVEEERLRLTINRIMERRGINDAGILLKIQRLIEGHKTDDRISTIPVKLGNRINLVAVGDIYFFEAKDKYVCLHTKDEEKLVDYSLSYLQERLPPEFIRVHRGFIVNKLKIKELHKYFKGTYLLVMEDSKNSKIKSAYSYSESIRTRLLLP